MTGLFERHHATPAAAVQAGRGLTADRRAASSDFHLIAAIRPRILAA